MTGKLVSAETARTVDAEASASWGLDPLALVEAAGRNCARVFTGAYPARFEGPRLVVLAGPGNNGADALVMLRALILEERVSADRAAAVLSRLPRTEERGPRSLAVRSLERMGVPLFVWGDTPGGSPGPLPLGREEPDAGLLGRADILIDGIAGTGLKGPLEGKLLEMVRAVNALKAGGAGKPFVVSIDVPSGNSDSWEGGMPILHADATLAIEPLKAALYKSSARIYAGSILPVGGIFPRGLVEAAAGMELLTWNRVKTWIPRVSPDAYKYERGVAEIRAGSPGSAGAARIAARGAQAAGAGIVRLVVDDALYPIVAPSAGGIMAVSAGSPADDSRRFKPDALLLGPGWGNSPDRPLLLKRAAAAEAGGTPLILDADAIPLAADYTFTGNTILTPHPGEFAVYTGLPREKALDNPGPILAEIARRRGVTILFKGHVLYIADPGGRLGLVDGMAPALATGGTGDLLAGFCVALAARMAKTPAGFDGFSCAVSAACLLVESGTAPDIGRRFIDPLELADRAADIAGEAWLPVRG
jgi:NAD(P)H-hydrate epimerase